MKSKLLLKIMCTVILLFPCMKTHAQGYNSDKVAFTNFLTRMFNDKPFEGVRAVNDYDNAYLISVVQLDKKKYNNNIGVINRIASVKALAQASRYLNGSNITQNMIIHTTTQKECMTDTEIIENIHENSVGYVRALEQLTNFIGKDGLQVFIFAKKLNCAPATKSVEK